MGLLDGKRILVTGVLTDDSLAFAAARIAQEQGAEIVLTGAGRGMGLTQRVARRLPTEPEVWELDVTQAAHVDEVRSKLQAKWGFFLNWTNDATRGHGTEFSIVLLCMLACLVLTGPGDFSLDGRRATTKARRAAGRARLRSSR